MSYSKRNIKGKLCGLLDCEYSEDEQGNITHLTIFNDNEEVYSTFHYDEWYRLVKHVQKNDKNNIIVDEKWIYNEENYTIEHVKKSANQTRTIDLKTKPLWEVGVNYIKNKTKSLIKTC